MASLHLTSLPWCLVQVSPCLEHRVRVWVVDRAGRQASFEWPRVVPAVSVEELVQASYRPDTPAQLQLDTEGEEGAVRAT